MLENLLKNYWQTYYGTVPVEATLADDPGKVSREQLAGFLLLMRVAVDVPVQLEREEVALEVGGVVGTVVLPGMYRFKQHFKDI